MSIDSPSNYINMYKCKLYMSPYNVPHAYILVY